MQANAAKEMDRKSRRILATHVMCVAAGSAERVKRWVRTGQCVARMERSAMRGQYFDGNGFPDFASLHPGYAGKPLMQRGALQVMGDLPEMIEPLARLVEGA